MLSVLGGILASADLHRIHPAGAAIMLAGAACALAAEGVARRLAFIGINKIAIQIVGLILCAGGALLAILG